jgi:hypothetical protein
MAGSYANMILVADYLIAKELELLADNQSGADSKQLQSAN